MDREYIQLKLNGVSVWLISSEPDCMCLNCGTKQEQKQKQGGTGHCTQNDAWPARTEPGFFIKSELFLIAAEAI